MFFAGPADEAHRCAVFVRHHAPPVVFLFIDPAIAVEGAGHFIGLHEGDAWEGHPGLLLTTGRLESLDRMRYAGPRLASHPDVTIAAPALQLATAAVFLEE